MLSLTVLTPEKTVYEGEITSVIAPGTVGYFQILKNHAPIISALQPGKLTIALPDGKRMIYAVSGGAFQCEDNRAVLLSEAIEEASEIDPKRAKEAYDRAYKRLEYPADTVDKHRAYQALLRSKNRTQIFNDFGKIQG